MSEIPCMISMKIQLQRADLLSIPEPTSNAWPAIGGMAMTGVSTRLS